ncbi:hypothetical protein HDV00_012804 [Rhizophlyctis rosea]|nr:hypothetical protein HDV00_012804 [Rhizophlyctis rosea]
MPKLALARDGEASRNDPTEEPEPFIIPGSLPLDTIVRPRMIPDIDRKKNSNKHNGRIGGLEYIDGVHHCVIKYHSYDTSSHREVGIRPFMDVYRDWEVRQPKGRPFWVSHQDFVNKYC